LDRLIQELTPQGTVEYQYGAIGRRTTMTVNGQTPVTYQYDSSSRLTQIAQGTQIVGLGYDAAGRRTSLSYPNGVSTSYVYDQSSRLLQIEHLNVSTQELIEQLGYTYDAAGNRISFTRTNGTATLLPDAVQAAYDAANEQIQFDSPTPNLTYDAN
jgi:YD repeat-containing protein